jgi:hypothetical protein
VLNGPSIDGKPGKLKPWDARFSLNVRVSDRDAVSCGRSPETA